MFVLSLSSYLTRSIYNNAERQDGFLRAHEHDLLERFSELGVKDGVDDRIDEAVDVAQPRGQ